MRYGALAVEKNYPGIQLGGVACDMPHWSWIPEAPRGGPKEEVLDPEEQAGETSFCQPQRLNLRKQGGSRRLHEFGVHPQGGWNCAPMATQIPNEVAPTHFSGLGL